ncbi:hypothetical protein ACROYT_G025898 [Oculina patagonica]
MTKKGWPDHKNKVPADAKPYWSFKEEIHEADGILFKSYKMIVSERLRPEMLKIVHESHLGIEKSKRRARDILYWPNMNAQITDVIANCISCLKHRKNNTKGPLIQHEVPDRPWQKIACDLFTLGGKDYLLTVNYYSKWVEIGLLRDSTKANEDGTDPYIAWLENRNTPITGLSYSPAQSFLNRRLKTKLPTATQLLNARIPTDAKSELLAQQKSQQLYFDRGAKSLRPVTTGDTVQMKAKNSWKPATVTKLAHTPRSVIVNSNGTLYRRNRHQDTGIHKSER